jgi:hypothetical protein
MPGWTGARSGADPHRAQLDSQIPDDRRGRGSLPARQAYLDGELCGVRPDGTTSFSLIQNASDTGNAEALVFFLFDLLHLGCLRSAMNGFTPYCLAPALH